jgi:aminoglycoside phosphotransferase (APT) family kinase protein
LSRSIADTVARTADELTAEDRRTLAAFVARLDDRLAALEGCGLPDTLVHGDFHPGNVRGGAQRLVLLDWGDCGVGHPLLDVPAFLDHVPPEARGTVRAHWDDAWRSALPDADPERASRLLAPVAAARQAVIYWRFLDGIEPSEWRYHRADPADWLRRTAALCRD